LPIEDIKANLLYLMERGRTIKFLDRTFNVKKDFAIDIFQFILDNHRPGNVFQFEITADIVHPDIVAFIQKHIPKDLFRFEIGIQTVNQKANLQVSRKQNFDKTSAIIKQLENKIEMHLDLIVGLPLDEWADIKMSIEEVFKLHPPELQLGFLKFLRGTPLRDKHQQHDYVFDPLPPYQMIQSKYLSKEELFRITLLEEALEIYWNKKRAVLTLKYISHQYSIFDFLLGLGEYFKSRRDFHQHTLYDIYDVLYRIC
jgi:anaerobic magnesium-protoporphyrin IX monomethyl ester cyclase